MERKKIVMFYGKENDFQKDPFENKGKKRTVFRYFFEKGSTLGFDMFLVSGIKNYLGNLAFINPLFFVKETGKFEYLDYKIRADAILDRSAGTKFPAFKISNKVLDNRQFKLICWNKVLMYKYLKGFCSRSYELKNYPDLAEKLKLFAEKDLVVLKPAQGLKGKGVIIDCPKKILQLRNLNFNSHWILQEFINTSGGIKGLVSGEHDLRIVIVNGKIVFSHIRQPAPKSKIANVAQGGSIREISLSSIPLEVMEMTKKLKFMIDKDFDKPLYSIDFGINRGKPTVFEINDTIGFPNEDMKISKKFIKEVLLALRIRTTR